MLQVWFHISYPKYISACEPSPYELFVDFFPNVYWPINCMPSGGGNYSEIFLNIATSPAIIGWTALSSFEIFLKYAFVLRHIDIIHLAVLSYLFWRASFLFFLYMFPR